MPPGSYQQEGGRPIQPPLQMLLGKQMSSAAQAELIHVCVYCVVIELRAKAINARNPNNADIFVVFPLKAKDRQQKSFITERRVRYSFAGAVEVEVSAEQPLFSFSFFSHGIKFIWIF